MKNYNDFAVADVTLNAFSKHLWYLSAVNCGLAFFDEELSSSEKEAMVAKLSSPSTRPINEKPGKEDVLSQNEITVESFVSKDTRQFFMLMGIDDSFLNYPPATWPNNPAYIFGKSVVSCLQVTNEAAERNIAFLTSFAGRLTTDEDMTNNILRDVEAARLKSK